MRTEAKVGLICAVIIVLGLVVFVLTRGGGKTAAPNPTPAVSSSGGTHSPAPVIPDHSSGSSAGTPIGGDVIGMPGSGSSTPAGSAGATPGAGASTPSPLAGGTSPVGTPGMGAGSPAAGSPFGTGSTPIAGFGSVPTGSGFGGTAGTANPGGLSYIPSPGSASTGTPAPGASLTIPGGGSTVAGPATTYKIQKGDMLATISKKYGVSVKAIETANPGIDANRLKVDTVIKIPAATASAAGTPRPGTASPGTTGTGIATGTPRPGTATPGPAGTPARTTATTIHPGSTYTIKRSDTLATISKAAYGNTGERAKIFQANRDKLDDPDTLPVGITIKIP